MKTDLRESYARCAQLSRRSASTFYPAFRLLPHDQRQAMCALYAFLRKTDDLGDSDESIELRTDQLIRWRVSLTKSLAGQYEDATLPALHDTVTRFDIPTKYLFAAIDGAESDLIKNRFATFEELKRYCYNVASSVGLACIHIWGFEGDEALKAADDCGVAFQLTNILRDIKEDLMRGRIYLPQEDFQRFGYSETDLQNGDSGSAFNDFMAFQIERTREYYDRAARLDAYLSRTGRRIFGAMRQTYRSLLDEIENCGAQMLVRRIHLGRMTKIKIGLKWLLFRTSEQPKSIGPT